MNILLADDEEFALSALKRVVKEAVPDAVIHSFCDATELMKDLWDNGFCPDAAFLDIEMAGVNGLDLAQRIQEIYPRVNIIFVTGYSQYALDAYSLRPSGYLTKPVTREDIIQEMNNLRWKAEKKPDTKGVFIRCFGNFEVQMQGQTVKFPRAKSMEALAYLVTRQGNLTSMKEIADALWEDGIYDRSRQKQMSVIRHDLLKTLEEYGIEDILRVSYSALAVNPEKIHCDYYSLLDGDVSASGSFRGEFMRQYSWAEGINAALSERNQSI